MYFSWWAGSQHSLWEHALKKTAESREEVMPLASTFQKRGLSPSYSPYVSPPLLQGQQRGKAGPTTGTPHPAKVRMQLLLQSFLPQPGKWTTRSGSWFLQGTSQLQYWECFINIGKFCLCFWWQKCLGLPCTLVRAAPLLALKFPKLELYWCSPQCYQCTAGEHKGFCLMWGRVTQHWPIHQYTKIQICFLTLSRSPRAPKQFNMLGKEQRWQVHLISLGIPLHSEKGQSRHTKNTEEKVFARQLMIPESKHLTIFHPEKAVL